MNFLADESCAGPVIQALRDAGHDVIAIAEFAKGTVDELVMRRAFGERRILVSLIPEGRKHPGDKRRVVCATRLLQRRGRIADGGSVAGSDFLFSPHFSLDKQHAIG
jgi:hypothetical protein